MNVRVALYVAGLIELIGAAYLLSGRDFAIALVLGYVLIFGAGYRIPRGPLLFPSYRTSYVIRSVFSVIYGVLILAGSPLLRRLVFVVIAAASGLDWLPRAGGRDSGGGAANPQ